MRPRTVWMAGVISIVVILILFGMYHKYEKRSSFLLTSSSLSSSMATSSFILSSTAFAHNTTIPSAYTCDGKSESPPLSIQGVPQGAATLVLLVEDPDVPKQLVPMGVYDHWILYNIPPTTAEIPRGSYVGTVGVNSAGRNDYVAPCPPKQYEPAQHRYIFRLYALDIHLELPLGATKDDVELAMKGHVIAEAVLTGLYKRP